MIRRMLLQPRSWWAAVLRGVIAVVLGFYIIARPASFAQFLTILAAAYVLISSVLALAAAVRLRERGPRRSNLIVRGVLGIIVGALALALPFLFVKVAWTTMLYLLAAGLIVSALIQIVGVRELGRARLPMAPGVVGVLISLLVAALLIIAPLAVGVFVLRIVGAIIVVYGVLAVIMGLRVRSAGSGTTPPAVDA